MTVEEALQILQGDPTEEEVFAALVALANQDETAYVGALPRAVEILTALGRQVTREGINTSVREIQTQLAAPQQATDVALGETEPAPTIPTDPAIGPAPDVPIEPEPAFTVPPIGVPPDFRAEREFVGLPGDIGVGPGGTRQRVSVPPRYAAGDEFRFQYASTTEIRRQQKELEAAGLLEPGSFTPGFWDQASADALQSAMGFANRGGTTWQEVVAELKSIPRQIEFERGPEFEPPVIPQPDPATIAQRVVAEFRGRLGREPTDEEMAEFGGYLTSQFGAAREAVVGAERQVFAAANFAEIASELGDPNLSPERAAEIRELLAAADDQPPQQVDPAARLQQLFDERFGPEMRFIEAQAETAANAENVFASLRNMTRLIG